MTRSILTATVLLLMTTACVPGGVSYLAQPGQFTAVPAERVRTLPVTVAIGPSFREVGTVRVARREATKPNLHLTDRVLAELGRRGANAVLYALNPDGSGRFVAYHVPPKELAALLDSADQARSATTAVKAAPAGTASTGSSGGTVHVKGYTRKDGTYVRPHTRRAPRKH